MSILVGGVGQLYQGDHDLGRLAVERLRDEDLGPYTVVEELHYGALAVGQLLEELRPDGLVLVGAATRGRAPGSVTRRWAGALRLTPGQVQGAVADAGAGYVSLDLVLEVGWGLGVLPRRTVAIEVEPARTDPSEQLSPGAQAGLEQALQLVRAEVRRAPLLELAERLRHRAGGNRLQRSAALEALHELLAQLEVLEREGRWAATFAARDRLRLRIASGQTGEGMDGLDWCLWWNLLEELDRLAQVEAVGGLDAVQDASSSSPRC